MIFLKPDPLRSIYFKRLKTSARIGFLRREKPCSFFSPCLASNGSWQFGHVQPHRRPLDTLSTCTILPSAFSAHEKIKSPIIVRVLFAIPFAILFAKIISANGNGNEFTLLALTYSSVYHIIRFTIFRFQNFLFFN